MRIIDNNNCLGSGAFGKVYRGTVYREDVEVNVAVKTIKDLPSRGNHGFVLALKGLLSEVKILSHIGNHNNIISLVGANTENLRKGQAYVFLELCDGGSLKAYLQAQKVSFEKLDPNLVNDLRVWSGQILDGLEFLAYKNVSSDFPFNPTQVLTK